MPLNIPDDMIPDEPEEQRFRCFFVEIKRPILQGNARPRLMYADACPTCGSVATIHVDEFNRTFHRCFRCNATWEKCYWKEIEPDEDD